MIIFHNIMIRIQTTRDFSNSGKETLSFNIWKKQISGGEWPQGLPFILTHGRQNTNRTAHRRWVI